MKTPDLAPRTMALSLEYVNRLLGMGYKREDAKGLLEKMRYGVKYDEKVKDGLLVLIPPYRTDILHPIDLVEDIAIAYGYANFAPELPEIATVGMKDALEKFTDSVRELMLGYGFQEVMTLIMTNKKSLFSAMMLPEQDTVEAENPVSVEHSAARTHLLPSLLSVLGKNKNREYPQMIFEAGDCILADGANKKKAAAALAHSKANFSETKAIAVGLMESLGAEYTLKPHSHASFIAGRCAATEYGFFGELRPEVLENFGLEVPVAGIELDIGLMHRSRRA